MMRGKVNGRPTIWTADKQQMARRLQARGATLQEIADAIDLNYAAVKRWMSRQGLRTTTTKSGPWTDEMVQLLREMWAKEESASRIGARIGVTRSAILGKALRLGLSRRSADVRLKNLRAATGTNNTTFTRKRPRPKQSPPVLVPDPVRVEPDLVIPLEERKTLDDLDRGDCRWPIGDPQHSDFHFCGQVQVIGLPYCDFHARRAYVSPDSRRSASRSPATARQDTVKSEALVD